MVLTGMTSLFTDISSEMIYPLIPVYLKLLGAGPQILGIIEGIAESTASLLKVFSGAISDRIRKRKILAILGYSLSAVGKFFLFLASGWRLVLLGRFSDRVGKGIRTAPRDALISESVDEKTRGRAFGLHRTLDTLGATLGVVASLLIAYFLLKTEQSVPVIKNIILISLIPAVIGILFLFFVQETGPGRKGASKKIPNLIQGFRELDKKLKLFLLLIFLFNLGNSSNMFLLRRASEALEKFGAGLAVTGPLVFYLVFNIFYTLTAYPAGALSDRIGRKTLLVAGYFIYSLTYFGFAFVSSNVVALFLLFAVYGVYMGLTEGVEKALVADLASPELKATVLGLHATLVGIGLLPASVVAGFLYAISPAYAFSFGGAMAFAAAVGMIFIL